MIDPYLMHLFIHYYIPRVFQMEHAKKVLPRYQDPLDPRRRQAS